MPTKLLLGTPQNPVRFSYAHVFHPTKMPNEGEDKLKFSCTFLWPKTDQATTNAVLQAMETERQVATSTKWGGICPANYHDKVLRDGDLHPSGAEEYKGMYYIVAKDKSRPQVVDKFGKMIDNETVFYSGCYGMAALTIYGFALQIAGKGMAWGLNSLMKTADGEPFSARESAETSFGDFIKPAGFDPLAMPGQPAPAGSFYQPPTGPAMPAPGVPPAYVPPMPQQAPQQPYPGIPAQPAYPQQPAPQYAPPMPGQPAQPLPVYPQQQPAYPQQPVYPQQPPFPGMPAPQVDPFK